MLPPASYIWKGRHGTWAGHFKPYPRVSRSWGIAGHHEAALFVIRALWAHWPRDNRLSLDDCPVEGIFSQKGGGAPAGGAKAAPAAPKAALEKGAASSSSSSGAAKAKAKA